MSGTSVLMLLGNNPYPADGRVRREATALRDAGYDVTVLCPRAPGQRGHEVVDGVNVRRYRAYEAQSGAVGFLVEYAWTALAMLFLSVPLARRVRAGVVHLHNPPDVLVAVAAVHKALGRRIVFDHHDLSPEMYEARFGDGSSTLVYRALLLLERLSCRIADQVIVTNESYARLDVERHGVEPGRVTVVRNGPEIDLLAPVPADPAVRSGSSLVVCFAGTAGPQDGIDHLVRAMHHVVHQHGRSDARCIVAGAGDAIAPATALAHELGVAANIHFTGHLAQSELVRHICSADLCVEPAPSNAYNDRSTTIKLTEYLALGRPVVAFDLPEHRVTTGDCAVYVPPGDDRALADAIVRLAADPTRRTELARAGRERAVDELAWDHIAPRLLETYRSLERVS